TMGVGSFTEDDVRNGAKALSGVREPVTQAMYDALVLRAQQQGRQPPKNLTPDTVKTGVFVQQRAYVGPVKFLGVTKQWDTKAVLEQILAQPATAPFIVTKVLREFVTDQPADAYVKRLAVERQLDLEQQRARAGEFRSGDAHRHREAPRVQQRASDAARRRREPGDGAAPELEPGRRDEVADPPRVAGVPAEIGDGDERARRRERTLAAGLPAERTRVRRRSAGARVGVRRDPGRLRARGPRGQERRRPERQGPGDDPARRWQRRPADRRPDVELAVPRLPAAAVRRRREGPADLEGPRPPREPQGHEGALRRGQGRHRARRRLPESV